MNRDNYAVDNYLDWIESDTHNRIWTLVELEQLVEIRLTDLEKAFQAHLEQHRENETQTEVETENVPTA